MTDAHPPAHEPHVVHEAHEPSPRTAMISTIFGIIGLMILLVIIIWGIIHIGSLFGGGSTATTQNAITVTAPATVDAGKPLTVSWQYTPKEQGGYAMLYQCKTGLQFTFPSGTMHVPIPCGVAFTLGSATSSATVLPLLAGSSTVSVPVTIIYIPHTASSGQPPIQGSVTVAIHPGSSTTLIPIPVPIPVKSSASNTQTNTQKPSTPSRTTVPARPADLSVRLISLSSDSYGNGVAVFDIANVGGSMSSSYTFQAQLPTTQPYTYTSPIQAPLAAGSHIENTLRFSQAVSGLFSVSISEGAAGNNVASQYLTVGYAPAQYQPTYQNGYPY